MRKERYLPISEFARISGVSRQRLIYYDNIGLFRPALVKPNGYRCYAHWQVETITAICILSDLGVSLEQIKDYLQKYDPEQAIQMLKEQEQMIEQKIQRLQALQDMLRTRTHLLEEGLRAGDEIQVVQREETPLYLSEPFHCDNSELPDELWVRFYNGGEKQGIPFCYPVCYLVAQEDLLAGDCHMVSHLCYCLSNPVKANGAMPAGRYLVGYGNCHYGDSGSLYQKMLQHIRDTGLDIGGNAYEEYLMDELATSHPDGYRVRISICLKD